jgi:hypothetical protein
MLSIADGSPQINEPAFGGSMTRASLLFRFL